MSTHNIGFYEDLTKIIFELSSNIIKYAPYFFCCVLLMSTYSLRFYGEISLIVRKQVFGVSDQVQQKPGCTSTEDGWRLEISY